MRKVIHNLRRQPDEIKVYILYGLTAVAGVILFTLWVYSFGGSTEEPVVAEENESLTEPLSALKANFIDGFYHLTQ